MRNPNFTGAFIFVACVICALMVSFVLGHRVGMVQSEEPALACAEVARTAHPKEPGVFAVTYLCRVHVEPTFTPPDQGPQA